MSSILSVCRCKATGGINTFRTGDIENLYTELHRQGRDNYIFADGTIRSPADFVSAVMDREDVWLYAGYDVEENPLAVVLLNAFRGTTAHMHFAFFAGAGTAHSLPIGSAFINLLFKGGLTALFGCTAVPFRHARKYAESLGFQKLGIVPGCCPVLNRHTGVAKYHDGWLGLCTPTTLIPYP